MDKIPFALPGQDGKFGTYVSKYPPDSDIVPANGFTGGTRNLVTSQSGSLEKLLKGLLWNPSSALSGPPLDQYEGIFTSGIRLLFVNDAGTLKASPGNGIFSTITGGTGFTNPANFEFATYQDRVYACNGVDNPIVIDNVTSYGGVTYTLTLAKVKTMGAQAPGSAPTASGPAAGGNVPVGGHTYKITFVYYNGVEESNGSPASGVVTDTTGNQTNALSSIPTGGYGVTARNIYRDNNDGNWLLLDTLPNNTATTYTDTLAIGATPTPIPFDHNVPSVFKYPTLYLDRIFAVDSTGRNIIWSLAGEPDVFTPSNIIAGPQNDVLTALFVYNGLLYAFGQHTVGQILGTTDDTFFYRNISQNTGCVDNRSIQVRELSVNPVMLWLSSVPNKGIYYTNGYTVQFLSDVIEDITKNLAQTLFFENEDIQDTQAEFQGGTSTPGIDLLTNPGVIQTINPKALYHTAADWQTGVLSNLAILGDQLGVPTAFSPADTDGTFSGDAQDSSGNISLPPSANFTGQSGTVVYTGGIGSFNPGGAACDGIAQKITPPRSGTLTNITFPGIKSANSAITTVSIWTDAAGKPGSLMTTIGTFNTGTFGALSIACSVALSGATSYWIVAILTPPPNPPTDFYDQIDDLSYTAPAVMGKHFGDSETNPASWAQLVRSPSNVNMNAFVDWTFAVTPISDSGVWTSPIFDSHCTTETSGMAISFATATYPSPTFVQVTVQGRNGTSGPWTTTDVLTLPTGTTSLTGGTFRYWRVVINLSTADNRSVPIISPPVMTFATTGIWTSPAILCTSDITSLDALTDIVTVPAGTSATILIATSHDNITYTSFTALGSATPDTYAKIRVTLTANGSDTSTALLSQAELDWSVVSTLVSSAIDTGVVPNGWGQFLIDIIASGVSVVAKFRTASTALGLSSATFVTITNGNIPSNTPLEFCQWEVILSATADNIPQVTSVTVQWLVGSGKNIRCASAFFDKSYHLAVANAGDDFNTLDIELDYQNNWRIHNAENIGTMGLYFNKLYYGDATAGNIFLKFAGLPSAFDVQTKCLDYQDSQVLKIVRSLGLKAVGTGTTIHVYYSIDRGNSWVEMLNSSGTAGFVTPSNGLEFTEFFGPLADGTVPLSGRNIIWRITSSDAIPCKIIKIVPVVYRRKGKYITEVV